MAGGVPPKIGCVGFHFDKGCKNGQKEFGCWCDTLGDYYCSSRDLMDKCRWCGCRKYLAGSIWLRDECQFSYTRHTVCVECLEAATGIAQIATSSAPKNPTW
ncbi:hypothetical protein MY5147_009743 [Beauveria neobassiana]